MTNTSLPDSVRGNDLGLIYITRNKAKLIESQK
jgi:hypothetical protein